MDVTRGSTGVTKAVQGKGACAVRGDRDPCSVGPALRGPWGTRAGGGMRGPGPPLCVGVTPAFLVSELNRAPEPRAPRRGASHFSRSRIETFNTGHQLVRPRATVAQPG